ncbi:hypothetical protein SRABI118_02867 [Massilia sp. Bi118]|uniref:hypothetical protein n=1 Tax=Massilia sp. Bi118 TaxID=2822346 RepID=UPI001D8A7E5D|nr:hypothetical protein [Massilia sp. Bi118]CAH0246987.1 hypothetical protein SRABI118_02867 [Massilia sp. Bi118]
MIFSVELTSWRKKQAAMLLYYSSLEYLITLHKLVTDLINGDVEAILERAQIQRRDKLLVDKRWGVRNTSKNWSNYAWPYLKDLQISLAKNIAEREAGVYGMTAVSEYLYALQQFSLDWMTPAEEEILNTATQNISYWATPLDKTMADFMSSSWNDFGFAYRYPDYVTQFDTISKFHVNTDIIVSTDVIPEKTGIYVSKDDPHAALQFAWAGKEGRKLREANTFNELGLDALAAVGRKDLWFNEQKMFDFATTSKYAKLLHDDVIWENGSHPDLAPSAVARQAFTKRPSEWYLVEPIEGEFEKLADLDIVETVENGPRIAGGEKCTEPGFYFAPSRLDSRRYFSRGDTAPSFDTQYGATIWQWDMQQQ